MRKKLLKNSPDLSDHHSVFELLESVLRNQMSTLDDAVQSNLHCA